MATFRIKFLATSVKMQMHLEVFLPEPIPSAPENSHVKVLWLLHAEGGDCSDWARLSLVEHYAQAARLALVMPNVDNSMYMDMAHGGYPYFTYLTEELPLHLRNLLSVLSTRKEDNFVAGISTGAYGAMKWALKKPQMFSGCACLSGDVDIVSLLQRNEEKACLTPQWVAAFDSSARIAATSDDTMFLCAQRVRAGERLPTVYLACSDRDAGSDNIRQTGLALGKLGLNVVYHQERAEQGWPFWDGCIRDFIETAVKSNNPLRA